MYVNADALLRSLPDIPDVLAKLQSGEYKLWGGVVRHAAGTDRAGQIVGHLLFPGDAAQTQQSLQQLQSTLSSGLESLQGGLGTLQQSVNVLQGLQTANLVMAGLNLAVTTAGFVIVCKKLNNISGQIEAQSRSITETLNLLHQVHGRDLLRDEARFRALVASSLQFLEQGDEERLKALVPSFHEEYQFTRLVLAQLSAAASANVERFEQIALLQDRLVHLGLVMASVQRTIGVPLHARQCLNQLASDIEAFNTSRIKALTADRDVAAAMTTTRFSEVTTFLKNGSALIPAVSYQAEIMELEARHPGLAQAASESSEILLLAA